MALADALGHRDGHVRDRISAAKKCHSAGGGVTEAVGQEVDEFAEFVGTHCAEARSQILHLESCHVAGKPVVEGIRSAAVDAGLSRPVSRPHDHVVAFAHLRQPTIDAGRVVLSIGVHEYRSEEHTSELQSLMRTSYAV